MQIAVGGRTDTLVFTDGGPRETAFPLLVTRTHRSNFKDGAGNIRTHASEDCDEVIEVSEALWRNRERHQTRCEQTARRGKYVRFPRP